MKKALRFKEFLRRLGAKRTEAERQRSLKGAALCEHLLYKRIPGTNQSYREDTPNTSSRSEKHAHVYAKQSGEGKELYSVNLSGKGHDGSRGIAIPAKHGEFFREKGYTIPTTNILESLSGSALDPAKFKLIYMVDEG